MQLSCAKGNAGQNDDEGFSEEGDKGNVGDEEIGAVEGNG